jgi:hypothetical protein
MGCGRRVGVGVGAGLGSRPHAKVEKSSTAATIWVTLFLCGIGSSFEKALDPQGWQQDLAALWAADVLGL